VTALPGRDRVIVALDVPDLAALEEFLDRLEGQPTFYKIGLELFIGAGPRAVEVVRARGGKVFLDLKLHDIPETVARAVAAAARLGPELLTVHASGGAMMLRRASEAAAAGGGTRILAVTVLTSSTPQDLEADGVAGPVAAAVSRRVRVAAGAGVHGLVCSPQEVAAVKSIAPALVTVVPGVRPAGATLGDQQRVATPAGAIAAGADFLVIGRPVRDAPRPAEAFAAVVAEVDRAAAGG
jgi:orotidine-5'-phosphate decarboxylase